MIDMKRFSECLHRHLLRPGKPLRLVLLAILAGLGLGGVVHESPPRPGLLQWVGSWPGHARGPAWDVALAGSYAYVALGDGGLLILDVSNPAHPTSAGQYHPSGRTERVQVVGTRAYLGTRTHRGGGCGGEGWRGQVLILDIQDPVKPVLLGRFVTSYELTDFCVDGDRLYAGDTGFEVSDFYVVDVRDASHPARLSANVGIGSFTGGCASGDRLYAASWSSLEVADVSQPAAPVKLVESLDNSGLRRIRGLQLVGQHLYLCGGDQEGGGVAVWDVNGDKLRRLGELTLPHAAAQLQVQGHYAYIANDHAGLTILDISDPAKPVRAGGWNTDGLALGVAVAGAYVYVADFDGGVTILNAADPAHLTLAGQFDTGLSPRQCVVNGGRAYLLSGDAEVKELRQRRSRLEILDIQNPSQPAWLGTYQTTQDVRVVELAGSRAFLAWMSDSDSGFEIVDLHEPARPALLSRVKTGLPSWSNVGFGTSGQRAYLCVPDALSTYDLTDPAKPVKLSQTTVVSGEVLLADRETLYLGGGSTLRVLNMADARVPRALGTASATEGNMSRLWLTDGLIHAAMGWKGFATFDVRQPEEPRLVVANDTVQEVTDIWSDNRHMFVAESWDGIEVFDLSDPSQPRPIARTPTAGRACGITVAGEYVYVLDSGAGLGIYRLGPEAVKILGEPASIKAGLGETASLEVCAFGAGPLTYQWYAGLSGDTAHPIEGARGAILTARAQREPAAYWVRVQGGTVAVDSAAAWVNALPPASLELVGMWPGWRRGPATDVALSGTLAYVAVGSGGLWIVDISDRTNPRVLARWQSAGYADRVVLSGNLAFVANGNLTVIDISQPAAPVQVGAMASEAYASKVALAGGYAYLQLESGELQIVEISDPTRLRVVGKVETGARLVEAYGQFACVTRNDWTQPAPRGFLSVVDVTDPTAPRVVGSYQSSGEIGALAVVSTNAYIVTRPYSVQGGNRPSTFQVINLSQPSNPAKVGSFTLNDAYGGLFVSETRAYVGAGGGVTVVDVSNPARPSVLGTLPGVTPVRIAVAGSLACAAVENQGLDIIDVGTPKAPKRTGRLFTAGLCQEVALCGELACLADGPGGIALVDISDPTAPVQAGIYRPGDEGRCVAAHPDKPLIYVAAPSFEVLDVSAPLQPKSLGFFDLSPSAIFVAGDYAYLNSGSLHVLDVRSPAAMRGRTEYSLVGMAATPQGFAAVGSNLCLSREWDGLEVLDLSQPDRPKYVASYLPEGSVSSVATLGSLAVIALGSSPSGLEVLDLRNPQQPAPIGTLPLSAASRIALRGSYAFVTGAGLEAVDLGDPTRPVRIASHQLGTSTTSLQVQGDLVYVAAGDYGLAVYRFTPQLRLDRPTVEGRDVRLSWLGGPGIRLQKSSSVSGASWEDVPVADGASSIRIQGGASAGFYRLTRP